MINLKNDIKEKSEEKIRELIKRRRLQLLVHSYIYYERNQSLISDSKWDKFAKELVVLQKNYPKISKEVDYYKFFNDFEGDTGYNLPYRLPNIINIAERLLRNSI